MLGGSGAHPEEKALLQGLFVNADPPLALRMLAPALHLLDRGSGQFNIVMPANIALWSGQLSFLEPNIIAAVGIRAALLQDCKSPLRASIQLGPLPMNSSSELFHI